MSSRGDGKERRWSKPIKIIQAAAAGSVPNIALKLAKYSRHCKKLEKAREIPRTPMATIKAASNKGNRAEIQIQSNSVECTSSIKKAQKVLVESDYIAVEQKSVSTIFQFLNFLADENSQG